MPLKDLSLEADAVGEHVLIVGKTKQGKLFSSIQPKIFVDKETQTIVDKNNKHEQKTTQTTHVTVDKDTQTKRNIRSACISSEKSKESSSEQKFKDVMISLQTMKEMDEQSSED